MPSVPDVSLYQCSATTLDDVCVKINKSVVFIDEAFAEILHWHGGATHLFNFGVLDVREFSSFESGDANQSKATFFISTPFVDTTMTIFRDIITASNFERIVVITNISPIMHSIIEFQSIEDEIKAFSFYKMQIQTWMETKNKNCAVEMLYLPLVAAPVLPSLFILPAHSDVFPLLPTDLQHLKSKHKIDNRVTSSTSEVEFMHLPKDLQLLLKLLTCSLNSLMELLSLSEEVFAVGSTSNIVAGELAGLGWNKSRKKTCTRKASLVIIDRTLDMASVVGHFQDTLLDKILTILPRFPGHHNDVQVDMTPVSLVVSNPNYLAVAPGCLSHPDDPIATALLNTMAMLKHKEAMMEINRLLMDAIGKELLGSKMPVQAGKVGVKQLEMNVGLFKGQTKSIRKHCGLLQLLLATIQMMKNSASVARLDSLLAMEKGLLQCLGDDEENQSPTVQILQILKRDLQLPLSERTYSVTDILLLLAFVYSLSQDHCDVTSKDEAELKSALTSVFAECSEEIVQQLGADSKYGLDYGLMVDDVLSKLRSLAQSRDGLKQYRNIYEPGSLSSQANLQPILKQIVEDIVDPNRPELVDVVHKAFGFGEMLKSGFGLFRTVSKPRPSDHSLLIVFVIGGVTTTEVRQIRDIVSAAKSNIQVLVGSTRLVGPSDVLRMTVAQDNLLATTTI